MPALRVLFLAAATLLVGALVAAGVATGALYLSYSSELGLGVGPNDGSIPFSPEPFPAPNERWCAGETCEQPLVEVGWKVEG